MSEKFRRYFLKDKDAKAFTDKAKERLGVFLEQILKTKANIELIQTEFAEIYLINGKPLMAKAMEGFFPTLVFREFVLSAPKVFVDMGAIPHVCNGANVMAPGIVRFEGQFRKGDFVVILDERHGKTLAIGEIVYDVDEARKVKHGIIVKNIHFVGDRIWGFLRRFEAKS
jgi:PUA domain protein